MCVVLRVLCAVLDLCVLFVPWVSLGGRFGWLSLGETCVVYVVVWGFFPVGCVGCPLCCVYSFALGVCYVFHTVLAVSCGVRGVF